MSKNNRIPKLPLELSAFTEFQRKHKLKELGMDLDAADKELCEAVVLAANHVYHSILENDFESVEKILGEMESTLDFKIKDSATYSTHATVICCWVQIAAKQALSELHANQQASPFLS